MQDLFTGNEGDKGKNGTRDEGKEDVLTDLKYTLRLKISGRSLSVYLIRLI